MSGLKRAPTHATLSDFVMTHCRTCAAGQTITSSEGRKSTFCLLLREWMTDPTDPLGNGRISDCDRYEARIAAGEDLEAMQS